MVRTTACSSQTKVKSILVDGVPMDRQVGVCWPSEEVQDLGLWPLQPLWAVKFMVSIWVFWRMPSFAFFPVPFAAGFHRNQPRCQRLLCTVVSKGALGLISLRPPGVWRSRLVCCLCGLCLCSLPQGLSDLIMNLCFIEFNLWEPSGPALEIIPLEGVSLTLASCQGYASELLIYRGVCGSVLCFGQLPDKGPVLSGWP